MSDTLEETHYFASPVYTVLKPEFLEAVREVSTRYEERSRERKKNPDYVNLMTASYHHEPELQDFSQYVSQTAWNILSSQGYAMDKLVTYFTEMWTQEHNHLSSMETHVHGHGAQISAFYFIDTPPKGCKLVIHDPRPGKVIINLPEKNSNEITQGSHQIVFTPQPGLLLLAPAWLPHSFTKNFSEEAVRFVHINLSVAVNEEAVKDEKTVEVV
ncbi:putative 2oG-fe(iI) oxygenase [Caudoviricetes sp.]|nr:putative 2oG-fe(iI) oxygenase [Caudoviricetes sp.]